MIGYSSKPSHLNVKLSLRRTQYPPILPHFPAHLHIQHITHHQNTSVWEGGVGLTCEEEEEGRRQRDGGRRKREGRRDGGKEGGREGGREGEREKRMD